MTTASDEAAGTALAVLSDTLWRLRELLGGAEYGLLVQRLLGEGGHLHHLTTAADALDATLAEIRLVEIVRATQAADAAVALGLPGSPDAVTVSALAAAAPEPWDTVLEDHARALRDLASAVATQRRSTEQALRAGAEAVDAALRELSDDPRDTRTGRRVFAGARLDQRA